MFEADSSQLLNRRQSNDVGSSDNERHARAYMHIWGEDSSDQYPLFFKKVNEDQSTNIISQLQPPLPFNVINGNIVVADDHSMEVELNHHQDVLGRTNTIPSRLIKQKKKKSAKKKDYEKMIPTFTTHNCSRQLLKRINDIYDEKEGKMKKNPKGDASKWIAKKLKDLGQKANNLILLLKRIENTSYISHSRLLRQYFNPIRSDEFYLQKLIFKEFFEFFINEGVFSRLLRETIKVDNSQLYNDYCHKYLIYLVSMSVHQIQ